MVPSPTDQTPAHTQLKSAELRIRFVVDARHSEMGDATARAGGTCDGEDHTREVVDMRMHDVVAPRSEQAIKRERKPSIERTLDHVAAGVPGTVVQRAVEPGQHEKIRYDSISIE
jgi:hypothetical protein